MCKQECPYPRMHACGNFIVITGILGPFLGVVFGISQMGAPFWNPLPRREPVHLFLLVWM